MFRRLWLVIRSWFGAGLDKLEDPELLLTQAQEEMTAMHAKNRERAVQAITRKNNLQLAVEETENRIRELEGKARRALERGRQEDADQIDDRINRLRATLELSRQLLREAERDADDVKEAIRREERKIREKTAEALALKAQLKNNQIQITMNKALEDMAGGFAPMPLDRDMLIVAGLVVLIVVLLGLLVLGR